MLSEFIGELKGEITGRWRQAYVRVVI